MSNSIIDKNVKVTLPVWLSVISSSSFSTKVGYASHMRVHEKAAYLRQPSSARWHRHHDKTTKQNVMKFDKVVG